MSKFLASCPYSLSHFPMRGRVRCAATTRRSCFHMVRNTRRVSVPESPRKLSKKPSSVHTYSVAPPHSRPFKVFHKSDSALYSKPAASTDQDARHRRAEKQRFHPQDMPHGFPANLQGRPCQGGEPGQKGPQNNCSAPAELRVFPRRRDDDGATRRRRRRRDCRAR